MEKVMSSLPQKQPQPLGLLVPKSPSSLKAEAPGKQTVLTVQLDSATGGYPDAAWPALTAEEEQKAIQDLLPQLLIKAQREKHYAQQRAAHEQKVAALNRVPATAKELFMDVQARGGKMAQEKGWRSGFVLDDWNFRIYKALAMYFTGDERFETEGAALLNCEPGSLSLGKGLIVSGPKGVGKSDMMELFARNPYAPYLVANCVELENDYGKKEAGPHLVDYYSSLIPNSDKSFYYGHNYLGVQFDDFGAEGEAVHMGKRIDLMETIIQLRYRKCIGPWTHLTTNASMKEIEESYDGRVYDRMIQMFNFIEFSPKAPSRRI